MPRSLEGAAGWGPLFWTLFDSSTSAIALFDEQRVFIAANAAMCELLGVSRDEILGRPADRFWPPQERSRLAAEWKELWETEAWSRDRTFIRADGSQVHVSYAARANDVDGRRFAVVVWTGVDADEVPAPPRSSAS